MPTLLPMIDRIELTYNDTNGLLNTFHPRSSIRTERSSDPVVYGLGANRLWLLHELSLWVSF